ncbi:MAG: helix-turn-helix domain-containing protein [Chloroflexota bacterium]
MERGAQPDASAGAILRAARLTRGLTLRQLADAIDVTFAYIADLEANRRLPSEAIAVKLAEQLGLDMDDLLACMGRLRAAVTDYLRERPATGKLLGRIAERKLTDVQLEHLLQEVDRLATAGDQPPKERLSW